MTPQAILRAARELVAAPERWTKHAYARAADGTPRSSLDDEARCWCLRGAFERASVDLSGQFSYDALVEANEALRRAISPLGMVTWNDAPERTHAEVLAALERAEKLAGGNYGWTACWRWSTAFATTTRGRRDGEKQMLDASKLLCRRSVKLWVPLEWLESFNNTADVIAAANWGDRD